MKKMKKMHPDTASLQEAAPTSSSLKHLPDRRCIHHVPLRSLLIVPFVLQIFAAVGLTGYISLRNGQKAVYDLANQLISRNGDVVSEHLNSYLAVPHNLSQMNADAIYRGLLNIEDRTTTSKYFGDQMQIYDLTFIGVGLTSGEGYSNTTAFSRELIRLAEACELKQLREFIQNYLD